MRLTWLPEGDPFAVSRGDLDLDHQIWFPERAAMIDFTRDHQSLTAFRKSSGEFMKLLKETKGAVTLTVRGKAAAVIQDAEADQRLLCWSRWSGSVVSQVRKSEGHGAAISCG